MMIEVQVLVTVNPGFPQRIAAPATMCCKVTAQLCPAVGPLAYVGGPALNVASKTGMSAMLGIGAPGQPGGDFSKEDPSGENTMDASMFLFDGDHAGDQIIATYSVNRL